MGELQTRVRAFVAAMPYTQEQFATAADVSTRSVSKVANGHWVSDDTRDKIVAALDRLEPTDEDGQVTHEVLYGQLKARIDLLADQVAEIADRLDQAGL